jgi:hypothetical protein
MREIKIIFSPFFFLMLILQACYNDKEEIIYPASANCDTTSNVSYSLSITPIINAHCLACHGSRVYNSSGGKLNLEGYSNIFIPVNNGSLKYTARAWSSAHAKKFCETFGLRYFNH